MKKYSFLIICFLFSVPMFAQFEVSELDNKTHLKQLSDGILFVQLPEDKRKQIEMLENAGAIKDIKKADKIKKEYEYMHREIIKAFSSKYEFSEFYFFLGRNTSNITKGLYSESVLDKNGIKIELKLKPSQKTYVALYGKPSVPGQNKKYFGKGFQIHAVENGKMKSINSQIFMAGAFNFFKIIFFDYSKLEGIVDRFNEKLTLRLGN